MRKMLTLMMIAACAAPAGAQQAGNGAVFPLPPGVKQIVSVDAQNSLLVQLQPDAALDLGSEIQLMEVQHVYSGGIARLFGGTVLPSVMFLTPGFSGAYAGGAGNTLGAGPNVTTRFNGNQDVQNGKGTQPVSASSLPPGALEISRIPVVNGGSWATTDASPVK